MKSQIRLTIQSANIRVFVRVIRVPSLIRFLAARGREDFPEGLDGDGEEVGPGDAARGAAAAQVRFHRGEARIAAFYGVGDAVRDLPVAVPGETALVFFFATLPIFDVKVGGEVFGFFPPFDRVVPAINVVGRVVGRLEGGVVHGREQVEHAVRLVAEDGVFVLVEHHDVVRRRVLGLHPHPPDDFVAVGFPVPVEFRLGGRIVAEYANVRRAEAMGQFAGAFENVEVRLERQVDGDLAHGRADGREREPFAVEERFELAELFFGQFHHVRLENRTELDVPDPATPQNGDLFARVRGDFIGEGGEREHGDVRGGAVAGMLREWDDGGSRADSRFLVPALGRDKLTSPLPRDSDANDTPRPVPVRVRRHGRGRGQAECDPDRRRRPGLFRTRLLRSEENQNARRRRLGHERPAVYAVLRGQRRLRRRDRAS